MPSITPAISQMNGGLIRPELEARTDLAAYSHSLRQCVNMLPDAYGGIRKRGGTEYLAMAADNAPAAALIPFRAGAELNYLIEVSGGSARLYKNGRLIMVEEGGSTPYRISVPWEQQDIFDIHGRCRLSWAQSGETLWIAHEAYPPQRLERHGERDWRISECSFKGGPWKALNTDKTLCLKAVKPDSQSDAAIDKECIIKALQYIGTVVTVNINAAGIDSRTGARGWEYVHSTVTTTMYGVVTVIAEAQTNIKGSDAAKQSIINAVNSNENAKKLGIAARNGSGSAIQFYSIEDNDETDRAISIHSWTHSGYQTTRWNGHHWVDNSTDHGTVSGTFGSETIEIPFFAESDKGRTLRLHGRMRYGTDYVQWQAGGSLPQGVPYVKSDGKFYLGVQGGTFGTVKPSWTEGQDSDGNMLLTFAHAGYGECLITAVRDEKNAAGVIPAGTMIPLTAKATDLWQWNLIGQGGAYPAAIAFFRDRLVLGINSDTGPVLCFSRTGDYENFEDTDPASGEALADCAIQLPLHGGLNAILWLASFGNALICGTSGSIIAVHEMTDSQVLAPSNITYEQISSKGACRTMPVEADGALVFAGFTGRDLIALARAENGAAVQELSLMARNAIQSPVISIALCRYPEQIAWCVLEDGTMAGCSLLQSQGIAAFHRHTTAGKWLNAAALPRHDGCGDDLYLAAARNEGADVPCCIERLCPGLPYNSEYDRDALADSVFLDSSVSVAAAGNGTITEISGLESLAGKTITVIADGKIYSSIEVQENEELEEEEEEEEEFEAVESSEVPSASMSGAAAAYLTAHTEYYITLPSPAKKAMAGLPYTAVAEPMPINADTEAASGGTATQRISGMAVKIYRTAGFEYSHDGKEWKEAPIQRPGELELKSGDIVLPWGANSTSPQLNADGLVNTMGSRMMFRQAKPFPAHFIAFYPKVSIAA